MSRALLLLLAGILFLRLAVALAAPVDLAGDEAYYWEWGRNPDWGYFSKPPLIGWLMGLAGWLSGQAEWGIRLFPVLIGGGTLSLLALLTGRIYGERAAFWAVAAIALSPGNAASQLIFTIDSPLLFSWSLALLGTVFMLKNPGGPGWGGGLLGFGLALGYLSKQMMLLFPLLLLAFVVVEPRQRFWLRRPVFWAVLVLPLLALIPPLYWNARNDWITFAHTGGHFETSSVSFGKRIGRFSEFAGSQLGLIGPVLFPLLIGLLSRMLWGWRRLKMEERLLWLFSAPALLVFLGLAFRQRILPNWPAVFYLSAAVLLAGWFTRSGPVEAVMARGRSWVKPGIWAGGSLMALMYLLLWVSPVLPLERDVFERIRGWEAYGETVSEVESRVFPERGQHFLYVVGHRYYASQLAFYHPHQPRVHLFNPSEKILSQYGLWPGPESRRVRQALLVMSDDYAELPEKVRLQFNSIEEIEHRQIPLTPHQSRSIRLYKGEGFRP